MSVLRRPDEAAVDQPVSASRRSVLAAAAGGAAALAALAANAVARPLTARAANGDTVTVGGAFTGTSPTSITNSNGDGIVAKNTSNASSGLFAYATASTGTTYGAFCRSDSDSGTGVAGVNYAATGSTQGVHGHVDSADGHAVHGAAPGNGIGVAGYSGSEPTSYPQGIGVYGYATGGFSPAGVIGDADDGTGVVGRSSTGYGVEGISSSRSGVAAFSVADNYAASLGMSSSDRTGVQGHSNNDGYASAPIPPAKTGVYGSALQDLNSRGVWGYSPKGRGVYGQATSGQGVRGYATTGAAVYAKTAGLKKGIALRAIGRVKLDKCAGVATIAAGTKSVTVTPGIDLVAGAAVVATLQGSAGGTTTVHRCAVNVTADTFTIYLTANSTANVKVAWHVFG